MNIVVRLDIDVLCQFLFLSSMLGAVAIFLGSLNAFTGRHESDRLGGRCLMGVSAIAHAISAFLVALLLRCDGTNWIWLLMLDLGVVAVLGAYGLMREESL